MHPFQDIGDDARRQYIDARAAFEALEAAQTQAAAVRGGMYWKTVNGRDYLIRTSAGNAQKSLGLRTAETEAIQASFAARKMEAETRVKDLRATVQRHQRLNRALYVGRVPAVVVDILNMLHDQGVAEHFTVVGTHAVYAYEAAAGVRVEVLRWLRATWSCRGTCANASSSPRRSNGWTRPCWPCCARSTRAFPW